jgi:plastocyanin
MAMAAVLVPSSSAVANHDATLTVQVGQYLGDLPAESMRFFPDEMTVHKGDTLKFMGEFHTATLLPTSVEDVEAWAAENASGPEDPYAFIKNNPDNAQFPLKLLGDNPFAPPNDCGSASEPCTYSGDSVLDSGVLFAYADPPADENSPPTPTGFSVTVDANPGDVFWVICRIHPNMVMKVTVAANNVTTTTQEDIDEYTEETVDQDSAEAATLHESLSTTQASHMEGGKRVWEAYSGYDTEDFSLLAMYPQRLNVRKGDKVEWQFNLHHEAHTVTFSGKKARRLAFGGFAEVCDPNGDDETGGETPVTSFPPMCSEGVHESLVGGRMVGQVGDGIVRGARDLENSGVRGMGLSTDPYMLEFAKRTTRKGLMYLCTIHPFMKGRVRVR